MAAARIGASTARSGAGATVTVRVEGVDDVLNYISSVEQMNQLNEAIGSGLDSLYDRIKDTAPYKTHYYEDHIRKQTLGNEGYISTEAEYSNYIIYGGPTLYHTAVDCNARGIHWPYSRVVGNLGIIHDIRRIVYEWEAEFDSRLDSINFTEPREYTSTGRLLPRRNALGRFTKG